MAKTTPTRDVKNPAAKPAKAASPARASTAKKTVSPAKKPPVTAAKPRTPAAKKAAVPSLGHSTPKSAKPTAKKLAATAAPAKPQKVSTPAARPASKSTAKPMNSSAKKTVTPVAKKPTAKPAPAKPQKVAAPAAAKPAAATAPHTPAAKKTTGTASKTASKSVKTAAAGLLSEAQILKMPEKDYMNKAQLAFFKNRLATMKDEILVNARETGEHLKENEVFADPNDRATVEEENMLEQRVRDRERKLLKKIDQALARIESGDFGFCKETGEPIGIPRLLARPTADLSIEAQEKHERLEKLYAD